MHSLSVMLVCISTLNQGVSIFYKMPTLNTLSCKRKICCSLKYSRFTYSHRQLKMSVYKIPKNNMLTRVKLICTQYYYLFNYYIPFYFQV